MRNRHQPHLTARVLSVVVALTVGIVAVALPVHANTIVDTGFPNPIDELWRSYGLAAEFTVSESWTITEAQGWFGADPGEPGGIVTFRLYSDGGGVPGAPLFSEDVLIKFPGLADFRGAKGLSWTIGPGSYWLAFEAPVSVRGLRFPFVFPGRVTTPLNEAFMNTQSFIYEHVDSSFPLGIGVRIFADPADSTVPVPEPASLLLFGAGLIGASFRIRRRARPASPPASRARDISQSTTPTSRA